MPKFRLYDAYTLHELHCTQYISPSLDKNEHEIIDFFKKSDNNSLALLSLRGTPFAVSLFNRYRRDIVFEFTFSEHISANVS